MHIRMGHPGRRATSFIAKNYEHGLSASQCAQGYDHCPICKLAKAGRTPTYPSNSTYDQYKVFELVFSDLHGPVNPTSQGGFRYMIHFMCATSRYPFVYFLAARSDAASAFTKFLTEIGQMGKKVSKIVLRSDNDTVYLGELESLCETLGIQQQKTAPYVHTNAAIAERFWRTLLDITRALLSLSDLPHKYWPLAARHAVYLYVRRPHGSLECESPYEQVFHAKPSLKHLRIFGSDCFVHIEPGTRPGLGFSKIDEKTKRCVYVGHNEQSATTLCLDLTTGKVLQRGHVHVIENVDEDGKVQRLLKNPPIMLMDASEQDEEHLSLPLPFTKTTAVQTFSSISAHSVYFDGRSRTIGIIRVTTPNYPAGVWMYLQALLHQDSQDDAPARLKKYLVEHRNKSNVNVFHPIFAEVLVNPKGRGAKDKESEPAFIVEYDSRHKNGYNVGYIDRAKGCQDVQTGQVVFPEVTAALHTHSGTYTHMASVAAMNHIGNSYATYEAPRSAQHSKSYPDAEHWDAAIQLEIDSFIHKGVIQPCNQSDIPTNTRIVNTRFVLTLKVNQDGTIDKYKARLVALGYGQVQGENFDETYAPVAQLTTVRTVLVLCLHYGIVPQHLDVKTAFLNATLTHEVYVKLPTGVTIQDKSYGKALKSIYGLKQAARDWYQMQNKFILSFDTRFKRSSIDPCLYTINENDFVALVSVHVDDYVAGCTDDAWYQRYLKAFSTTFEITNLGVLSNLLQMKVEWQPFHKGVSISQPRYIKDTAERYGILGCKPMQTPMEKNLNLTRAIVCDTSLPYRNLIGALLWIARATRPDINFAVIYLSTFLSCYDERHFKAAKRVLRYLVTTVDKELTYHRVPKSRGLSVKIYSDSDWAGDANDRISFSGSLTFLNGSLISWNCRKQRSVALSSTEAEYMALSDATRETLYVQNLISEFFTVILPIPIFVDNKGAGYIAENDINNKLTKHIDIRYHFTRQHIREKTIELFYVPSADNVADICTKALGPEVFIGLANKVLRINPNK